eukprot:scaffold286933_cov18-Tisochrysis_lutea.AAC.1
MHDTAASHFDPSPEGPFEANPEDTQSRWVSREIKLKNTLGMDLPPSTYRCYDVLTINLAGEKLELCSLGDSARR